MTAEHATPTQMHDLAEKGRNDLTLLRKVLLTLSQRQKNEQDAQKQFDARGLVGELDNNMETDHQPKEYRENKQYYQTHDAVFS